MLQSIIGLSFVAAAAAHQNFHQFWVNDVSPGYQVGIRMPPSNSPVTDVTSNDIACNVNGSIVPSGVKTIAANEGDKITVGWDISSHPGPITHMLFGPVDDAAQATGIGAGWFKIQELDYSNGTWANQVVGNNGGNFSFSLPTGLASGDYLLRSEMLALHGAQTIGGGQFYIGCAQLTITGTGASGSCSPTISLPGAYSAEDPSIYIPNVYNGFDPTNYTAPGGPVASCAGSGSGSAASSKAPVATSSVAVSTSEAVPSASAPASSSQSVESAIISSVSSTFVAPTLVPTTLATVSRNSTATLAIPTTRPALTSSSALPAGTEAATGTVALYGQCGGINHTGATQCAAGATCKQYNDFYSQCVSA